MEENLDKLVSDIKQTRNYETPPLHLWHPPLSGEIDIVIDKEGQWYHEGDAIKRASLIRLFASILRKEDDNEFYLVTPVEKWRISVALHPLRVTDVGRVQVEGKSILEVCLNTQRRVVISSQRALFMESAIDNVAAITLEHGLTALFSRAAWYRLVELGEEEGDAVVIKSGDYSFKLTAAP